MIGANFAFLILMGQVPAPADTPASLVERLGAGRYAQRESAAAALERMGRRALPALRSAKETRDPEIRSRATILIDKIEGALLTQPTMITLDFSDRPLAEVLKSMGEQCGIKMALFPEQLAAWQGKRLTLHESSPLPFWRAIDRLCETAQLQYNFGGMHGFPNHREPVFPLFAGTGRPPGPMSDAGPFRVNLVSLHYQRDVSFLPTGPQPFPNRRTQPMLPAGLSGMGHTLNEQFYAQIQIAAEPRLALSQNGPLRILEAVDDLGQSMLPPANGAHVVQRYSAYFGLTSGSTLHIQAPLKRPDLPGKSITRLRGTLPVLVATRKANPLVIPLNGATGKSFQNDEVTVVVEDIRSNPQNRQVSLELSIRPLPRTGGANNVPALMSPEFASHRPDLYQQQIEVVDITGRPIPWYHSNDAEGSRMTLTLTQQDQGAPTEVRYYGMARATTDVGFAFEDVPMP